MSGDVPYTADEWRMALEAAEMYNFDSVVAGEKFGPLAAWLADEYTEDKVDRDTDRLRAVIDALTGAGHDAFTPEMFHTVVLSARSERTDDFDRRLWAEWAE